ncbi:MAG TPA: hypothetical protein VI547_15410 [Anaerolineales bacterium]|nr:hypothetical protein [Anaerolineales bacterium]HLF03370.1 hypothetical protein [Anaerolineales bacterium]
MASADIRISLSGGESMGGMMRFEPGGVVQGSVQVTPQDNINCKSVYVRFGWHTEGRGDRDSGTAVEIPLATGAIAANVPISQQFNVILPKEPWSYAGHYINIIWEAKVTIDIPLAADINAGQPFIMAPRP